MWRPKWLNRSKVKVISQAIGVSCMHCAHFDDCPIIRAWVETCEQPMEIFTFHCSEFEELERAE